MRLRLNSFSSTAFSDQVFLTKHAVVQSTETYPQNAEPVRLFFPPTLIILVNAPNLPTASHINTASLEVLLRSRIKGDVFFDEVKRGVYATDASLYQVFPQCVVVPKDEADIIASAELARQFNLPITARGGGTSLSGQTYGSGIIIDVSKFHNQILELNIEEKWARVQSGAVRDVLNAQLAKYKLHFAPDPATGSRATIGGMVGNNTCGTRSIVYGKSIDHVLECRVLLSDGTICHFKPREPDFWKSQSHTDPGLKREAELLQKLEPIIDRNRDEIVKRYPKVLRRVSGYNLDEFVDGAGYVGSVGPRREHNQGHRVWNLSNLIVGSEGTLGILLDAQIRLTPNPQSTALCVVHFDSLQTSLKAVARILEFNPSTVELLDITFMDEARINPATRHMAHFILGDPQALQVVEFMGASVEEATQRAQAFADQLKTESLGIAWPIFNSTNDIRDVWETRKLGLGLISNVKGPTKGRDFIEDACIPIPYLAEYIGKVERLCQSEGLDRTSIYAHASVGVVHVVPAVNVHEPKEIEKMERIARQAFQWTMEYGGSWSGEHGDGQLRGQFLPDMFGEQLYQAFCEVKQLFDPLGLMNPRKIVNTQRMTENLRYQTPGYETNSKFAESKTLFKYASQGGFQLAVEQCNGVGACRKLGSGTMCPSYMATRDEHHSTRGRANALRLAMSGQLGKDPIEALASEGVDDCLSLCLACKACKTECPNAVDMAKLKSEVMQMRHDKHGTSLGAKILGRMPDAAKRLAGKASLIVNFASMVPGGRRVLEKLTGIDRRRPLPPFAKQNLASKLKSTPVKLGKRNRGKVVLFDDTYANYFEPHVGYAAIQLLEDCGFEVIIANAGCCQRTRLSKGLVREAKRFGAQTFANLDQYASQNIPILCLEPSCASALADDVADLIDDHAMAGRVSKCIKMIDTFLAEQGVALKSDFNDVLLHGHCHQKALFGTKGMHELYQTMEGTTCREVDSGCCGMAGSFGYEHLELSKKIGEDRLFPAVRAAIAEGKTVVACGISCRHQLKDLCNVEAKHWVETVLCEAVNS